VKGFVDPGFHDHAIGSVNLWDVELVDIQADFWYPSPYSYPEALTFYPKHTVADYRRPCHGAPGAYNDRIPSFLWSEQGFPTLLCGLNQAFSTTL
jgi:hypothetical protein